MMTKIEVLWRDALQQASAKPIEANGYRLTRMTPESRFDIYRSIILGNRERMDRG